MNLVLVLVNIIGLLAIAAAIFKVLETGPSCGQAFSPAARLVLLALIFLCLCAVIETMAWRSPVRPVTSALIFACGIFACWRAFAPRWVSFLRRPGFWHRAEPPLI